MSGWTKVPNIILDAVPDMSEIEQKLTFKLVRLTFGYHTNEVKLTYDDMQELTGIRGRASITKAVNLVEARGFFVRGCRSMWRVNSSKFEPNAPVEIVHEVDDSSNSELKESTNSSNSELNDGSNSSKFELDYSSNFEPSSLYINKDVSTKHQEKERESEDTRSHDPPDSAEPDEKLNQAWETAVSLANWFRSRTGQSSITAYQLQNGSRDRLVSEYIEPANALWYRLDRDRAETERLIWAKYQTMLRDGLRPKRLSAIVPQIFGDLDAEILPPAETAVSDHAPTSAEDMVAAAMRKLA